MIEMIYMEIVYEIYECECLPYFFFHVSVGRIVSASCSCIQKWWSVSTSEPRKSDPIVLVDS